MRFIILALLLLSVVRLTPPSTKGRNSHVALPDSQSALRPSTWSIVAADRTTGDVGVAAASCVTVPIDAIAALVPGRGAGVAQGSFLLTNRAALYDLLQQETDPDAMIAALIRTDGDRGDRQYGLVVLPGMNSASSLASSYTGDATGEYAGGRSGTITLDGHDYAISVQGNLLESEAVISDTLAAFMDDSLGPLDMADRLLRAVEAGSAAGGDKRCNQQGITQTASAAFLLLARGDEPPYAAPNFGFRAADDPAAPALALSVSNPLLGANPLLELRRQYDSWRADNLPACDDCNLSAIAVPPGGTATSGNQATALWTLYVQPILPRLLGLIGVGLAGLGLVVGWQRYRR